MVIDDCCECCIESLISTWRWFSYAEGDTK
jgi:hypothetical protein